MTPYVRTYKQEWDLFLSSEVDESTVTDGGPWSTLPLITEGSLRRHNHCRPYLPRSVILPRPDRQPEKHTLTAYFRTNNELDWDTRRKGTGRTISGDRSSLLEVRTCWRGFCFGHV
jgi:hypothetical protein